MLSFNQKRQLRRVATSRIMHGVLLVVCLFTAHSAYGRYAIARDMAERRVAAERELAELETRRAVLKEQVEYITSERGIEAEMRRQFDIAREGERVVIILDEPEIVP
jgi:cell division protein FtsB